MSIFLSGPVASLCEKCPITEFFSGWYFPVLGSEKTLVFGNFSSSAYKLVAYRKMSVFHLGNWKSLSTYFVY